MCTFDVNKFANLPKTHDSQFLLVHLVIIQNLLFLINISQHHISKCRNVSVAQ